MINTSTHITSCLAEVTDPLCQRLAQWLNATLGSDIHFLAGSWPEREAALEQQTAQLGLVCGLLHVHKGQQPGWDFEPIVAPVMRPTRYGNQPVYFADVVVHQDSPYQTLDDLAGSRWAYNEPASFSGHHMMLVWLAQTGKTADFFGERIQSGAHSRSLVLVAEGVADCAAIDSTVLDMERVREPGRKRPLRTIGSLGPYPMPPLVVSRQLPAATRHAMQQQLATLHEDEAGRALLAEWGIARLTAVSNTTYDPIRQLPINMAATE